MNSQGQPDGAQHGDLTLLSLFRSGLGRSVREDAAAVFVQRYMEKLTSLVERNLSDRFRGRVDAGDVVQDVLASWFRGVGQRRIRPNTPNEIWPLIVNITLFKVRKRIRKETADIRDPGPEEVKDVEDLIENVCSTLPENLRQVFQWTLEDCSVREIASRLDRSTKTIRAYMKRVREHLLLTLPPDLQDAARRIIEKQEEDANSEDTEE
jgi:RNA polymerase sigma factor (sigma-70 family)